MADWRIGRGWSKPEIERRLISLHTARRNFDEDPDALNARPGWHGYTSESVIGRGRPGPPTADGPFERCRTALVRFEFSDPTIVRAHFDDEAPLLHRVMLLELRAFRQLRFLTGAVVGAIREERHEHASIFGYRYETLVGHIERGAEWFLLTKEHETGTIRFRIAARWLPGDFPNWWSALGFRLVGRHYQKKWHRRAHQLMANRLAEAVHERPVPKQHGFHTPDIIFERT